MEELIKTGLIVALLVFVAWIVCGFLMFMLFIKPVTKITNPYRDKLNAHADDVLRKSCLEKLAVISKAQRIFDSAIDKSQRDIESSSKK